jgi:hypothetical protein
MNTWLLRLARPLAFILGTAFTLIAISSFILTAQVVISDPSMVLPDETLWTAAQLEATLAALGMPGNFYAFYTLAITLVFSLTFLICGWLILLRRSQDWFGLYLALLLLAWGNGVGVFTSAPVTSPWAEQIYLGWFMWPGLFLLLYYFPTGQVDPRWARWFAWSWILFCVYGLTADILNRLPENFIFFLPLIFAVLLVGIYAQVFRFRHAGALERQQIKPVVFALVLMAAFFIIFAILANGTGVADPGQSGPTAALFFHLFFNFTANLVFMGIPVSIAVAILRYRLWDIDVIIRRTLVYGGLTATLVLVYFGSVLLLQSLFQAFTGQSQSPLVIVISTLAIAALFNPLRKRIQTDIDRRFYRRKYDAEKMLEIFAAQLRQEVDLDEISRSLLAMAAESMQPEYVSLWVKDWRKK